MPAESYFFGIAQPSVPRAFSLRRVAQATIPRCRGAARCWSGETGAGPGRSGDDRGEPPLEFVHCCHTLRGSRVIPERPTNPTHVTGDA